MPIDPSLMTKWRKQYKSGGMEKLLAETIQTGLQTQALKKSSFARLNVDTTVQEKAVTFPTDAKLYNRIQKRDNKNKLYSLHAEEVECISKGKAHKKYEFGCKVSVATTSKDNFVVGIQALPDNPYDGHTLKAAVSQGERLGEFEAKELFVDRGYRGHDYEGKALVHVARQGLSKVKGSLRKWLKRRSAIEPVIGHMKNDGRLGRNYLLGAEGDKINALLCGAGHNIRKLLAWLLFFLFGRFFKITFQPVN